MKRIVFVEDNADNRLLVQVMLGDMYEMIEFVDGLSALAGLEAADPDLVLLDISLPEMDGTEVLKWIREQPSLMSLPVIALTAHAMDGDRERYLGLGFDDYLTKPILDEQELINLIEHHLTRD